MALFDCEDKLLFTRRAARLSHFPKAWVLPGGHIDSGESLEEGVIREIREETGIDIQIISDLEGNIHYHHNG